MGIIAILLFSAGRLGSEFYIPYWVVISCNFVIGLGTLMGGWRIVYTMGEKITTLTPMSGSCAAVSAALSLFAANIFGVPVSTTHTVTGAIIGVGTSKGFLSTHWSTVRQIVIAWILTIPASAVVAASVMYLEQIFVMPIGI
jgi:PiT family inorganic phosphate transporter